MASRYMAALTASAASISLISSALFSERWATTALTNSADAWSLTVAGADAQQLFQPQGVLAAVGRQEMDLAALADGGLQRFAQVGQRPGVGDADPGAAAFQRRLRAHPDDVLHVQVVAENRLPVLVDVDDRGQARENSGRRNKGTCCPGGSGRCWPGSSWRFRRCSGRAAAPSAPACPICALRCW